jgi:hypothetical protein
MGGGLAAAGSAQNEEERRRLRWSGWCWRSWPTIMELGWLMAEERPAMVAWVGARRRCRVRGGEPKKKMR